MENMYILKSNNSIIFNHGNINEVVFNFKEYKDILNNLSTEKYDFFKIIHEKYNIKRLLKELVGIYKPKAQNKNLDFRVSIASDIPEYLYGDEMCIRDSYTP